MSWLLPRRARDEPPRAKSTAESRTVNQAPQPSQAGARCDDAVLSRSKQEARRPMLKARLPTDEVVRRGSPSRSSGTRFVGGGVPIQTLVTGGAGFIGSTLVDALLAAGHHVDVVD